MPENTLRNSLSEIERTLQEVGTLSEDDRLALKRLHARIEAKLHPDEPDPPDLLDQAQDAITRLEAEHPKLTAVLNRIAHALGAMGV